MTEDADLARLVRESDDRIAQKLFETGERLSHLGNLFDAWSPHLVAQEILLEALIGELGARDPELVHRIADRVEPTLARYPDALRQAVAKMLRARRGN